MQPEIQKTSLGACEYISWEVRESVEELVSELKQQEYELVAVEINSHSQSLIDYCPVDKVAYIMGNEIEGVSKQTLKSVDQVRHIPMAGKKESLNVSVAAGVVMYHGLYKK
jgi:tRNA G18 (ribose-2'-O)-methylase SpoU